MRRGLALALVLACCAAAPRPLLLDETFPIEVSLSAPSNLLHWLDSLAGLTGRGFTAGKTVPAHRTTFHELLGPPTPLDVRMLRDFRRTRTRFVEGRAGHDRDALTLAFLEARTIEDALATATALVAVEDREPLASAIRHFATRHDRVWNDGRILHAFLGHDGGPEVRSALARFLADVARFYGVEHATLPPPVLVPLPVADGFGTHAQAIGRYLLVEVLPGDGVLDQVPPIVHEAAHFLYGRVEPARHAAWRAAALERTTQERWELLSEALPTAIAQGVAAERFRPSSWSIARPWYHEARVDDFAKRIFPIVRDALASRSPLDSGLAARLASALEPGSAR